jgi:predicted ATPase
MVVQQWSAAEVVQVYAWARELCRLLGDPPQLLPVLFGLNGFHTLRAELNTARELSSELPEIAQRQNDPALLVNAQFAHGVVLYFLGEIVAARTHFEQVSSLYHPSQHQSVVDMVVTTRGFIPCVTKLSLFGIWAIRTKPLT